MKWLNRVKKAVDNANSPAWSEERELRTAEIALIAAMDALRDELVRQGGAVEKGGYVKLDCWVSYGVAAQKTLVSAMRAMAEAQTARGLYSNARVHQWYADRIQWCQWTETGEPRETEYDYRAPG